MKVGRNLKTKKSKAYWKFLEETAEKVKKWPKWKQ